MIRVTTNSTLHMYQSNLMQSSNQLYSAMEKLMTGRNFDSYASNPAGATRAFKLHSALNAVNAQAANNETVLNKFGTAYSILDEVTNELDIPTLTILEDYLNSFIGIVILVSHDRYFLDNVSDRIFAFDGCGHFRQYEGGYTEYLESKNRENGGIAEKSSSKASAEVSGGKKKATWDKGEKKLKFSYKEQKEFETIDDDIAALEQKIEELDAEMVAHASQYSRLS